MRCKSRGLSCTFPPAACHYQTSCHISSGWHGVHTRGRTFLSSLKCSRKNNAAAYSSQVSPPQAERLHRWWTVSSEWTLPVSEYLWVWRRNITIIPIDIKGRHRRRPAANVLQSGAERKLNLKPFLVPLTDRRFKMEVVKYVWTFSRMMFGGSEPHFLWSPLRFSCWCKVCLNILPPKDCGFFRCLHIMAVAIATRNQLKSLILVKNTTFFSLNYFIDVFWVF